MKHFYQKSVHPVRFGYVGLRYIIYVILIPYLISDLNLSQILEDGYAAIKRLSNLQLKCTLKIKFLNFQGLEEAGLDQKGLLREFLNESCEEILKQDLNFFKRTPEGTVYVSPTSYIQENYLQYFYYFGRILGKALYEGVIPKVSFADFVLSKFIGRYSYFVSVYISITVNVRVYEVIVIGGLI